MNEGPEVVKAPFLNSKMRPSKTQGKYFCGYQGKINKNNNHKQFSINKGNHLMFIFTLFILN